MPQSSTNGLPVRSRPRPHLLLAYLLILTGLAGCAAPSPVRPPTPDELAQVDAQALSVVLFRLSGTIDGKPATKPGAIGANDAFQVLLANLDRLEAPARVPTATLSASAASQGWHYWLLAPGVYHLLVVPPGGAQNPPATAFHAPAGRFGRLTRYAFTPGRGAFWSPELMGYVFADTAPPDFEPLAGFWFEVPKGGEVVYLGSLTSSCTAGRGLLGDLIDSCTDFQLATELAAAQQVAADALPGRSLSARELVPYGAARADAQLDRLGHIAFAWTAPSGIAAALGDGDLGPWLIVPGMGNALVVFNLLSATFELAHDAIERQRAEQDSQTMQPCLTRLAGTLTGANHGSAFMRALEQAAVGLGAPLAITDDGNLQQHDTGQGQPRRLIAALPILRLVEGDGHGSLAVEVAMDVRLQDARTQALDYYSLLAYGPDRPARSPFVAQSPLYTRFVPQQAAPRPLAEWCGPDGAALLAAEIAASLGHIAAQVARDLYR